MDRAPQMALAEEDRTSAYDDRSQPSLFTKREFLGIVFKYWPSIFLLIVVVTATLGAGLWYLPPTYVAEGKLLLRTDQQATPSFYGGIAAYREPRESDPANRRIETEMELLATRGLSENVVKELNLQYDDVFHPAYVHLLNPVADLYDHVKAILLGQPVSSDRKGEAATVRDFNKSFTVEPLKSKSSDTTSNIIRVQLRAPDPRVAKESLEKLFDGYVNFTITINQSSGVEAFKVVQQNLVEARAVMDRAQARLQAYIARPGGAGRERESTPVVPRLQVTSGAASDAPASAKRAARTAKAPETVASDESTLRVLRARLTERELKLAEIRRSYQDDTEEVRDLENGILEIRQRIAAATAESAEFKTTQLQLERELRTAEDFYGELKKRLDQITLFLVANPQQADIRNVIEPPIVPRSSEWRRTLTLWVLGSLGGVVLAFGFAGFRAYGDHTLQNAEDVARYLGAELIATLPALGRKDKKALEESPRVAVKRRETT